MSNRFRAKSWLPLIALLAMLAGCRDQIAAPTMGHVEARAIVAATRGEDPVEVLDDAQVTVSGELLEEELTGVSGEGSLGPLPAGIYRVSVTRAGYDVFPSDGLEVEVSPAETTFVDFSLVLREVGSVDITTRSLVSGDEIAGAQVWHWRSGNWIDTGETTPTRIENLPIGTATFELRDPQYSTDPHYEASSFDVQIDTGVLAQVDVDLVPPRGVLGEMFTYQVCPNCPEAAERLKLLHEGNPGRVFVIEWHTWQILELYSADGAAREAAYGGGQQTGWPATIIQGELPLIVGSGSANLDRYTDRMAEELAGCTTDCSFVIESTATTANIFAKVLFRSGNQPAQLKLRFVQIENGVLAPGNQPHFDFVGRAYHEETVSFSGPGDVFEASAGFGDPGDDWDYVVYLQSDDTLEVLAVHGSH